MTMQKTPISNKVNTKICSRCNKELLATRKYFYLSKSGKYGLRSICIECDKKYAHENWKTYYENHYDTIAKRAVEWKRKNVYGGRTKLIHNDSRTRLYNIWIQMRNRCDEVKSKHYDNYAGRGISVCKEWQSDYLKFKEWALQNGYSNDLTLDRKDNNGNYEPSNCRWVTMQVQSNNKRGNCFITFEGETKTISEWSRTLDIPRSTLNRRIKNNKWPIENGTITPTQKEGVC